MKPIILTLLLLTGGGCSVSGLEHAVDAAKAVTGAVKPAVGAAGETIEAMQEARRIFCEKHPDDPVCTATAK